MAERKLYRADLAELAGVAVNSLDRIGMPERDGTEIDGAHARPWWWESTARRWLESRPGRGWRAGRKAVAQ